jgi:hypothetical protein
MSPNVRYLCLPTKQSPQGGVAASSRRFRVATARTQPGWFTFYFDRKTTPASRSAEASQYFLIAQPPLLAVMQGGTIRARFRFVQTLQEETGVIALQGQLRNFGSEVAQSRRR